MAAVAADAATTMGQQFAQHYYTTFNQNKAGLMALYNEQSQMTFEREKHVGQAAISAKLQTIAQALTQPKEVDTHLVMEQGGQQMYLIQAQGDFKVDPNQNALKFVHSFILIGQGGSFFIKNEILKLVYG